MGRNETIGKTFPSTPGVYLMKNARGEILYIGKAQSLKDRVRSYFQKGAALTPRIRSMVDQVEDVEFFVTESELEALILENNLIKKHRPRYNVVLRDDKNYPYLRLPIKDDFPRLEVVRRTARDGALYFGPYVPAHALRETLKAIYKVFPLATCTIEITGKAERACIEYEIKRCLAPCTGNQSREEYHSIVNQVRLFLEGKDTELLEQVTARMEQEAERLNFEEAARLRDRIAQVRKVLEKQRITSTSLEDQDVIALAREDGFCDLQVLFVRGGALIGRKDFFWEEVGEAPDEELCESFIQQFYSNDVLIPQEVVLPVLPTDAVLLEKWLSARREGRVKIVSPKRGRDSRLLDLAKENAEIALKEHVGSRTARKTILEQLKGLLSLSRTPIRIEGFDISNIQGRLAVGSLVVFEEGWPKKEDYRHFRIKTIQSAPGGDDVGMLAEVLTRHYSRVREGEGSLPDLILIDGGKGQLSTALATLSTLGVEGVDVIGLAKAREEKGERVYLHDQTDPVVLPPSSPATHLLMRVRDEAHRFAITYHRKLRGKAAVASLLDEIPGIGPVRRTAVLRQFGSIDRLREAPLEELLAVPQLTKDAAQELYDALRR